MALGGHSRPFSFQRGFVQPCAVRYDAGHAAGEHPNAVRRAPIASNTFVTMAFSVGVKIPWLEQQTGVRYDTLRRHCGKWVPLEGESELQRFEASEPGLFDANCTQKRRGWGPIHENPRCC